MDSIIHSGVTWVTSRRGPNGLPIWPIEEYLARTRHGVNVRNRIRRLNPNGKEEGAQLKGWHPHRKTGGKRKKRLHKITSKGRFLNV